MVPVVRKALGYVGVILIGLLALSFFLQTSSGMPSNAILLVDHQNKVYYAPPYMQDYKLPSAHLVSVRDEDLRGRGYMPDPRCRDEGYFTADDTAPMIVYYVKERLGLNRKRWNGDGTWNW